MVWIAACSTYPSYSFKPNRSQMRAFGGIKSVRMKINLIWICKQALVAYLHYFKNKEFCVENEFTKFKYLPLFYLLNSFALAIS